MTRRGLQSWLIAGSLLTGPVACADPGDWAYGLYLDISYANDFTSDNSIPWRSKLTTRHLNSFDPNMAMAYASKTPSENSPWGGEFGLQGGSDMDAQKPPANENPIAGANFLTGLSKANVSYLAPVGNGLKLTAGLMNSFIGFESMYAGSNPNYTRAWMADYSPYFLLGAGGEYAVSDDVSASFFVVTDYNYLAFVGYQPKYAAQYKWNMAPEWSLTQNLFFGPEQQNTSMAYWRGFSDTILHWKTDDLMLAAAYDIGTEKHPTGGLQSLWMGSAIWTRWHIGGPWSVAVRPEVYWDPDGELTGKKQFISAITTTAEYRLPLGPSTAAIRTEFRHDNSTGPEGGFYNPAGTSLPLVANQNLFFLAVVWTYDVRQ